MISAAVLAAVKFLPLVLASHCKGNTFFFLPPWYKYLTLTHDSAGGCQVANFQFPGDIWAVVLAIIDMLLRIAGFVAVIGIIVAGAKYMGADGNPEKAAAARKWIYNSIIGLFIALTATALVSFIGNRLG